MIKFLLDVLQIAIAIKFLWMAAKWMTRRKKSRRKSVVVKISTLISNRIHHRLDSSLKKQKEALRPQSSKTSDGKVVQLRKTH